MSNSFIYLIEAENGLVKIGRATVVRDRVTSVRTHSPVMTRLIATWRGAEDEEQALHRRFAAYRRHNEWFEIVGSLQAFCDEVRGKNTPDIPEWSELLVHWQAFAKRRRATQKALKLITGTPNLWSEASA